jgi:hypothetical protein
MLNTGLAGRLQRQHDVARLGAEVLAEFMVDLVAGCQAHDASVELLQEALDRGEVLGTRGHRDVDWLVFVCAASILAAAVATGSVVYITTLNGLGAVAAVVQHIDLT